MGNIIFTGHHDTTFSDPQNWDGGIAPSLGDLAFFSVLPPQPATFTAPAEFGAMYFDIIRTFYDADGTPTAPLIQGGQSQIALKGVPGLSNSFVVQYGTITFSFLAQLVTNGDALIGDTEPGLGIFTPADGYSRDVYAGIDNATPDPNTWAGNAPNAGLRLENGAEFHANAMVVGSDPGLTNLGAATVTVTGFDSILELGANALFLDGAPVSGLLSLGTTASGTLDVSNGGLARAVAIALGGRIDTPNIIGSTQYLTTGSLNVTGANSRVETGTLAIGGAGVATVTVSDGGVLSVTGLTTVQTTYNPTNYTFDGQANLIFAPGGTADLQQGVVVNGGTISLAVGSTYTDTVVDNGSGTLVPTSNITLANDAFLTTAQNNGAGGTVTLNSWVIARANINDGQHSGTIATAANAALELDGGLHGTGDITIAALNADPGSHTVILSAGGSNYTGTVTVQNGVLKLTGDSDQFAGDIIVDSTLQLTTPSATRIDLDYNAGGRIDLLGGLVPGGALKSFVAQVGEYLTVQTVTGPKQLHMGTLTGQQDGDVYEIDQGTNPAGDVVITRAGGQILKHAATGAATVDINTGWTTVPGDLASAPWQGAILRLTNKAAGEPIDYRFSGNAVGRAATIDGASVLITGHLTVTDQYDNGAAATYHRLLVNNGTLLIDSIATLKVLGTTPLFGPSTGDLALTGSSFLAIYGTAMIGSLDIAAADTQPGSTFYANGNVTTQRAAIGSGNASHLGQTNVNVKGIWNAGTLSLGAEGATAFIEVVGGTLNTTGVLGGAASTIIVGEQNDVSAWTDSGTANLNVLTAGKGAVVHLAGGTIQQVRIDGADYLSPLPETGGPAASLAVTGMLSVGHIDFSFNPPTPENPLPAPTATRTGGIDLRNSATLTGGTLDLHGTLTFDDTSVIDNTATILLDGGLIQSLSATPKVLSHLIVSDGTIDATQGNIEIAQIGPRTFGGGGFGFSPPESLNIQGGLVKIDSVNTGVDTITLSGGTLELGVTGSAGGTAVFGFPSSTTIRFTGANTLLELDSGALAQSAGLPATPYNLQAFNAGDRIDLLNQAITLGDYQADVFGQVRLTDLHETLSFGSGAAFAHFTAASDSNGGTLITLAPEVQQGQPGQNQQVSQLVNIELPDSMLPPATIDFTDDAGQVLVDNVLALGGLNAGVFEGPKFLHFSAGNDIVLRNLLFNAGLHLSYDVATGVLSILDAANVKVAQLYFGAGNALVADPFHLSTNAQGQTVITNDAPPCFLPGTLIATPDGPRAIETLSIGDHVLTTEGESAPIRWIGRRNVAKRFGDPLVNLPIRIAAGALAEAIPARDLYLSPDHAIEIDGVLIQAGALVNHITITRWNEAPEFFTYFHIELETHALILAEATPAETFVDNADRMAFDNWSEHEALYGHLPTIPELPLPRAKSHRQVPSRVRALLAARLPEQTQAA